jgi:hypothetical protein
MYASSLNDLGRFYVPEYVKEEWVPAVRYIPEPPAPIRGAMNPWQQERQRVLWMAEEKAWKDILPLQAEWRTLMSRLTALIARYNALIGEIEDLVGPTGLQQAAGYLQKIPTPIALVGLVMNIFGGLFGGSKKKKAEGKIRELEAIQAEIAKIQDRLMTIQTKVQELIGIAQTVQSQQIMQATMDIEQSEMLYSQRQATERARGQARRALYQQTRLIPQPARGTDVL